MATLSPKYVATNQPITCTLNSLANSGARESTYVDNATNLYLDALLQGKFTGAAASVSATGGVDVYVWGTADTTTPTYPEVVTGADAAITLASPTNLILARHVNLTANNQVAPCEPISVASLFGGTLPPRWGVVVSNATGASLASSGNSLWFEAVQVTSS